MAWAAPGFPIPWFPTTIDHRPAPWGPAPAHTRLMDGPLKELDKLERLAAGASAGKGKAPSVDQSLDVLLEALRNARERFLAGTGSQANLVALAKLVESKKKDIDDRQKELYNATAKVGKALDKVRSVRCCLM